MHTIPQTRHIHNENIHEKENSEFATSQRSRPAIINEEKENKEHVLRKSTPHSELKPRSRYSFPSGAPAVTYNLLLTVCPFSVCDFFSPHRNISCELRVLQIALCECVEGGGIRFGAPEGMGYVPMDALQHLLKVRVLFVEIKLQEVRFSVRKVQYANSNARPNVYTKFELSTLRMSVVHPPP